MTRSILTLVLVAAFGTTSALPAQDATPLPLDRASLLDLDRLPQILDLEPLPEDSADPTEPPLYARPDATVYTYGETIPRLTCLPYRACAVLLHPDESILHLALGDSERWEIANFSAPAAPPTLVLKPLASNLFTNLVVRTDQRLYVLELLSPKPSATDPRQGSIDYDAVITFSYPNSWTQTLDPPPRPNPTTRELPPEEVPLEPDAFHFGYRLDRPFWPPRRLPWEPDVIFDDGQRTFLRLPPAARRGPLPAVLAASPGAPERPIDAQLTGEHGNWLELPVVASTIRLVVRRDKASRELTILRTSAR